jgi:uncharacterized protein (DUF2062 family)
MQMLLAACIAIMVHSNLPISVGLVWISNPLTMAPIFYLCYKVGAYLLGIPDQAFSFELSWEWLTEGVSQIWWPLLLGSVVCGLVFSILSYVGIRYFWIWKVGRSWKKRAERRRNRS